jgi:Tol biopolymer transport system component
VAAPTPGRRAEIAFLDVTPAGLHGRVLAIHRNGSGLRVIAVTPSFRIAPGAGFAVAPDGSRIAYTARHGLALTAALGGQRKLIAPGFDDNPLSWSPNGRWILFTRGAYGSKGEYLVRPDGTRLHEVASVDTGFLDAWTPDSKHLLAETNDFIIAYDLAGHRIGRVPHTDRCGEVTFSPDGKRVALRCDIGGYGAGAQPGIKVGNADFTGVHWLITPAAWSDVGNNYPVWSPDGTRIAYDYFDAAHFEIRIVGLDGKREATLHSPRRYFDGGEVWAPDGSEMVFERTESSSYKSAGLWIWDVSTGKAAKIYGHAPTGVAGSLSWITP